ncbi:MAG: hypothetical protein AVDCRST_MAG30-112, partial [uncultured Solirubrobacteraceae bacterium]
DRYHLRDPHRPERSWHDPDREHPLRHRRGRRGGGARVPRRPHRSRWHPLRPRRPGVGLGVRVAALARGPLAGPPGHPPVVVLPRLRGRAVRRRERPPGLPRGRRARRLGDRARHGVPRGLQREPQGADPRLRGPRVPGHQRGARRSRPRLALPGRRRGRRL